MSQPLIDMTVETVLTRWPQTAVVFNYYATTCIGCAVASFCQISEAAATYNIPADSFVADLEQAIAGEWNKSPDT